MTVEQGWHWTNGKTLRGGRPLPKIGEWLEHGGEVVMCRSGLHYSSTILDALQYAPGATLHRVSVDDVVSRHNDKGVCRKRRINATADMLWPLVCFAENCATRAAAEMAARAAAAEMAARAEAAAAANWAAEAAREARAERKWQNDTLELYFACCRTDKPQEDNP